MSDKKVVSETLHKGVRVSFDAQETLYEEGTGHHRLELIRNALFGKVLLLDGAVQVTSADEFMYHEMMAHVPLMAHENPADVLIIGGGDCGLAEEVLKHKRVKHLTQIEIDASVVDFSREHFQDFNAPVFEDPRFTVEIADGAAFAAQTDRTFDVILVDSTDPSGPGAVLFTTDFYKNIKQILRPGGIVVSQNGVPFLQPDEFSDAMRKLDSVFAHRTCYLVSVPTYFGGHMTLGWASDSDAMLAVSEETLAARAEGIETRYYTPAHHKASFALPRFIGDLLEKASGQAG